MFASQRGVFRFVLRTCVVLGDESWDSSHGSGQGLGSHQILSAVGGHLAGGFHGNDPRGLKKCDKDGIKEKKKTRREIARQDGGDVPASEDLLATEADKAGGEEDGGPVCRGLVVCVLILGCSGSACGRQKFRSEGLGWCWVEPLGACLGGSTETSGQPNPPPISTRNYDQFHPEQPRRFLRCSLTGRPTRLAIFFVVGHLSLAPVSAPNVSF